MLRPPLTAFLFPFCLLSLACSSTSVQRPTASFQSAEIGALTAEGFTVNFGFDVDNPNNFDLPIRDADYALSLASVKVIDDQAKPKGALRAGERTNVTVPVRLSFNDLLQAGRSVWASGGDIPYEFDGALGFTGGGGLAALGMPQRVPLRYSGTLPHRPPGPPQQPRRPTARPMGAWNIDGPVSRAAGGMRG